MRIPIALLTTCVLAQAPLSLHAQFEADPIGEYVNSRLSAAYIAEVVPVLDYVNVDSVVLAARDDADVWQRIGSAVVTVTEEAILIEQDVTDLDGVRTTGSLSAPPDDPADGTLTLQHVTSVTEDGRTEQFTLFPEGEFAGGRLRRSEIPSVGFLGTPTTAVTRYGYDADGRVVTEVTADVISGMTFPSDSTVIAYDADDRPDVATSFTWEDDGMGPAGYTAGQRLEFEYVTETHFLARATGDEGETLGVFEYYYGSGVLDSFFLRQEPGVGEIFLGIYRTDDGSNSGIVTYDYQLSFFGDGGPESRATYYFDGAVAGASARARVEGAIAGANPTRVGATYRLDADEVPTGARWRVTNVAGQVITDGIDAREALTLPDVGSGIYQLTVLAPGYAPLSRAIVVE